MERFWYALTETCLAFTVFRDDFNPKFIALFTVLLFLKSFHWLAEDRVDYVSRDCVCNNLINYSFSLCDSSRWNEVPSSATYSMFESRVCSAYWAFWTIFSLCMLINRRWQKAQPCNWSLALSMQFSSRWWPTRPSNMCCTRPSCVLTRLGRTRRCFYSTRSLSLDSFASFSTSFSCSSWWRSTHFRCLHLDRCTIQSGENLKRIEIDRKCYLNSEFILETSKKLSTMLYCRVVLFTTWTRYIQTPRQRNSQCPTTFA